MKKSYQKWLVGALACALAVPFTGCSNEDDPNPGNGNKSETYNAQFTVAFTRNGAQTRATTDEVGNGNFQGMKNIKLLAFETTDQDYAKVTAASILNSVNQLKDIPAATGNNAFVEKFNISLNPATVNFLFYGESAYGNTAGALTPTYPAITTGAAQDATFALTPLDEKQSTDLTAMTTYLKSVVVSACTKVKQEDATKEKLENFFAGCTSPSLQQIAYMLAQLYLADIYTDGGQTTVQGVIAAQGNPVFGTLTNPTTIADIMAAINGDPDYLGEFYPDGGMELEITPDLTTAGNSTVTIVGNTNTYNKPTTLYYMGNTYPVEYNNEEANAWGSLSTTFVDLATQPTTAIALKDQIQYAVGQLELNVTVKAEGVTGGQSTSTGIGGNEAAFNETIQANEIQLISAMINNQNKVGWDFKPDATDNSTKVAYDKNTDLTSKTMYMLALPTKTNQSVALVLELKNNSEHAFVGKQGIIPAGATFYMTAELSTAGKETPAGVTEPAVFMSDYKTIANITINSLQKAENTVPDLSASNLEFALSVDLDWQQGYTFDVPID